MFDAITQKITNTVKSLFGGSEEMPVFDNDLVGFVDAEYKRRADERRPFELQWRLNLAFLEGNQYIDINTASMSLEEQPIMYDWQEREVFNHIAPNIETRISKLKRVRSVLKAQPGTSEQSDIHRAKVSTQVLRDFAQNQRLRDKSAEELIWIETCGCVFRKHVWNPNFGRLVGNAQYQGPDGQPATKTVREGDLEIVVVPPQEVYPDSTSRNGLDDCRSIIHARAFHIDDIYDIWGISVGAEKAEVEKIQQTKHGMGGLGYGQGGFLVHNVKLENHAIVKEYMELPSKKYPDGRIILVAGGKLLYAGILPYKVGEDDKPGYPFSMAVCINRPGIFWPKTVLERLIPVQRRYNALRNRKAEYLNRCAIGMWEVKDGSLKDMDAFERDAGMPGAIVIVNQGFDAPKMIDNPRLPGNFETEEATLLNEFAILSGVSEISRQSQAPAGVKSGVALAIVQEQDDTRLSNTVDNIERANIQSGKIQLRLAKQYVKVDRTLYAMGKNNIVEVMDWIGSDIRSENIILDNMSATVESPAQRRQMIFDLLESGLLVDPDTGRINKEMRAKALEMIELGDWEATDDSDQLQISRAERENRLMEKGQMAIPANYDDDIMHISRHNCYRLTAEYEELVAQFPMVDQMFEQHVNLHMLQIQQAQAMQAQAMLAARASPMGGDQGAA